MTIIDICTMKVYLLTMLLDNYMLFRALGILLVTSRPRAAHGPKRRRRRGGI